MQTGSQSRHYSVAPSEPGFVTVYAKKHPFSRMSVEWLFQTEPLAPGLGKTLGVFQKYKEFKSQAVLQCEPRG